jgi:hypothetical protein
MWLRVEPKQSKTFEKEPKTPTQNGQKRHQRPGNPTQTRQKHVGYNVHALTSRLRRVEPSLGAKCWRRGEHQNHKTCKNEHPGRGKSGKKAYIHYVTG